MIPLHCLRAKLNNRTRGQFECDMNFFFLFVFISFPHMKKEGETSFEMVCPRSRMWKKFERR